MKRNYYSRYELAPADDGSATVAKTGLPGFLGNVFSKFAIDDLILLAVILILITDEQPDMITILALLYIFLV